jgi:acyl carrier protein
MSSLAAIKAILADTLQLGARVDTFDLDTPLLGSIPELDSIAVINLITALEEQFGFTVADDEISADTFASVGSLLAFVEAKSVA